MPLLFVYGTLRRGEPSHHYLKGAPLVAPHVTEPVFTLHDLGWYPGAAEGGATAIVGELYDVSGAVLAELDEYEGEEYALRPLTTAWGEAQMYVYRGPGHSPRGRVIKGGDWCARPADH